MIFGLELPQGSPAAVVFQAGQALLLGILVSLLIGAWPAIEKYGLGFLSSSVWDPVTGEFGGLVMIYGTIATSLIALLIAVPVSFGIALFLTELSPAWLKRPLGTAIELLAAVPSIVYGMWGLLVFGPLLATWVQQPLQALFADVPLLGTLFSGPPVGIGILSAGVILAIMIIPFIAAVMRDVFEVTPPMLKESAYEELATAIRTVHAGKIYLSPSISNMIVRDYMSVDVMNPSSAFANLSPRERNILQHLSDGKSTKEIASMLQLSTKTVETHRRNIMGKTRAKSVAELTKYAIRAGITSL